MIRRVCFSSYQLHLSSINALPMMIFNPLQKIRNLLTDRHLIIREGTFARQFVITTEQQLRAATAVFLFLSVFVAVTAFATWSGGRLFQIGFLIPNLEQEIIERDLYISELEKELSDRNLYASNLEQKVQILTEEQQDSRERQQQMRTALKSLEAGLAKYISQSQEEVQLWEEGVNNKEKLRMLEETLARTLNYHNATISTLLDITRQKNQTLAR